MSKEILKIISTWTIAQGKYSVKIEINVSTIGGFTATTSTIGVCSKYKFSV